MVKEDAPKGLFDVIVGWHTDRLARNADEMTDLRADLRKIGVQATSVLEPIEITDPKRLLFENPGIKKLLAFLLDWKAEQDNFTRTERLNLGKQGKAKKGLIPCKAPYGYRKCIYYENGDRNKKVEEDIIVPEEARVVTLIYDSYDFKGMGLRKIAVHLNDKGISAPRGGEWCYSTVKYILQNVTYIGVVRWGWRLSCSKISRARLQAGHQGLIEKGMHEPIISEEQFERVKKKLESRKKLGGRAVASKGLLTGLLKCGICGENAYISSYPSAYAYQMAKRGKRKEDYARCHAYICSTASKKGSKACKKYMGSQRKIEGAVIQQIKKLASSQRAQKAFEEEIKKDNTQHLKDKILLLQNEISKLPEVRHRYSIAYGNGVMNIDEYGKTSAELNETENKLRHEISELEKEIGQSVVTEEKVNKALQAFKDFNLIWKEATFERKKDLIRDIIKEVRANGKKIELEFNL